MASDGNVVLNLRHKHLAVSLVRICFVTLTFQSNTCLMMITLDKYTIHLPSLVPAFSPSLRITSR